MITLQNLLNDPGQIDLVLKSLEPLKTPVVDNVFKTQRLVPSVVAKVEDVADVAGAVPLVPRTSEGVNVAPGATGTVQFIEAYPIKINDRLTAAEANDFKLLKKADYRTYIADILDRVRRRVRATTEGLCAQALTGQINYPLLYETGQWGSYQVDFTRGGANATLSYTAPVLWSDTGASVDKVIWDLMEITRLMQEAGFGSKIRFWAGANAYKALMGLVNAAAPQRKATAITAAVEGPTINIGGFVVELANFTYKNPETGAAVKVVDDNKLLAWDEAAPFTLMYLAIDNFKAGLSPRKLFVQSLMPEHGQYIEIFAESKPLPVPVPKAICWATVAA